MNVENVENAQAAEPGYFRTQPELADLYAARGVTKDKEVITWTTCETEISGAA